MNRKALLVLSIGTILISVGACSAHETSERLDKEPEPSVMGESLPEKGGNADIPSAPDPQPKGSRQVKMNLDFKPGFYIFSGEYKSLTTEAKVPAYSFSADLSNVENMDQFSNLTQEQRAMISKNGSVVTPTDSQRLFYIYENNTYKKVPGFVTADPVLQLYHIFYDYSLRNLETEFLRDDLNRLNESIIRELTNEYQDADNIEVKDSIRRMLGYFGVASLALGQELPEDLPTEAVDLAGQEYDLAQAASGKAASPMFGFDIEYSLFKIRGHYTRNNELGKYFRTMSWCGIVPMPFYDEKGQRDEESAIRAIVTVMTLCKTPADSGVRLWEDIYSTTSLFAGGSNDITPYGVAQTVQAVYTNEPNMDQIPHKLEDSCREVEQIRNADILRKMEGIITQPQMRFMGQRYIPDSEILQELAEPYKRPFPCGMDVFVVFGPEHAEEILDEIYQPKQQWDKYEENFRKLADQFRSQAVKEQTGNLYNGWLYCLKSLTSRVDSGYPLFMRNIAWENKSLSTALGSWAEIRHDTILYGKQSGTECGDDEPPEILGYVEPNPEFFNRLLWLTTTTREDLPDRGLLSDSMKYKMLDLEGMLDFLKACAWKELNGENLSLEEHYSLLTYGDTLEYLSSSIAEVSDWYLAESDTDKHMAVIADVHTSDSAYLETGMGTTTEIYMAVLQYGKIYLTRGAVFDYYELVSGERLTDEEWQEQLKQNPSQRPPFTDSFMDKTSGGEVPVPDEPYSTGC